MMRVMFVDDEERVLDGLRRMLRGQRHEWEMVFVNSGGEAVKTMEQEAPFDVVISDMKMPGMNGAELLTRVRDLSPATVRIILSGQADKDAIVESIPVTHQYLAKPCEPDVIKDVIARARELHQDMNDPELVDLLGKVHALPTLPSLFAELNDALRQEDVTTSKIGDIISKDIGMSGELLKVVNSAFFGLRREVSSVDHAVSFLGVETISALVMATKVFDQFDESKIPGFSLESLWRHSLLTAQIAKTIARTEGLEKDECDVAFIAGLLHDAGQLVLAENVPDQYAEVMRLVGGEGLSRCSAEQRVLGTTHGQVGAYLFGIWGLPAHVVEAVAYHVDPSASPAQDFGLLGIVHVSDAIARAPQSSDPNDDELSLDWEYLVAKGVDHKWPVWREAVSDLLVLEN